MKISFTTYDIELTLSKLGINYTKKGKRYWSLCPNPSHNDTIPKNFSIKENGDCKCYACGFNGNLIHVIRVKTGIGFVEALNFLGKDNNYIDKLDTNYKKAKPKKVSIKKESKFFIRENELHKITDSFISTNSYLSSRGYTESFCNKYGIKLCKSKSKWTEKYDGYIIVPLPELNSFEARNIYRENGKDKVLYPYGVYNKSILFDLTNLDINEDLIITEGTATLAKLYASGYKNITSIFGKEVSMDQVNLLNSFKKRKILIVDPDKTGINLIHLLYPIVKDLYIWNIPFGITDESENFESSLKSSDLIPSVKYLIEYHGVFE